MSPQLKKILCAMLGIAKSVAELTKNPKDDVTIDALAKLLGCYD